MKQDIEASVIGGLLIGGLTPTASDVLATLEPEAFSIPLYRKAFEVIRKQARNRNLIDALMVAEACGEEHFTSILMTSKNCPSAANLKGYAGMVADNYHRRLVLEIMDEMREPIQSGTIDASSQAMDELVKRLSAIRKPRDEVKPVRLGEIITDYTDTLDRRLRNGEESDTLKTGIEELDAITGGMNAEDLVISRRLCIFRTLSRQLSPTALFWLYQPHDLYRGNLCILPPASRHYGNNPHSLDLFYQ